MHATHSASFLTAESCMPEVVESASQTGVDEVASHPSCVPDIILHLLHSPSERHIKLEGLVGQSDDSSIMYIEIYFFAITATLQ